MKNITNVSAFIWQYGFCLALFFSGILQAQTQEKTVTGIVTTDSIPLMGVSITIKDTDKGVITDIDGTYKIQVQPGDFLIYSHLGYEERAIQFLNQKEIDIDLQLDATALGTVEITGGYYSLDERTRTGNVTKVDRTQLDQQVIQSPIEALQGRVAGLEVQSWTGLKGQAPMVMIRGQGSIKSFADIPLYIIDGIPINNESFSSLSSTYDSTGIDPLSTLDPSLIESIEVLKDADATAIYGSRGANGVIIINTKRGQAEKTKFEIQAETGASWVGHFMDLMNTEQYLEMRREAFQNDEVEPTPANAPDLLLWDQSRYTDWQKELIGHTANYQKYQASLSGGTAQTSFLLSGGFEKQGTVFPGDFGFQGNNLLANLNHQSKDNRFQVYTSVNYGYRKSELFNVGSLIQNGVLLPPNTPDLFNEEGNINWELDEFGNPTLVNPIAGIVNPNTMRMQSLQWNGTLSYQLLKGFLAKINVGFHSIDQDDQQINYAESFYPGYPESVRRTTTNRRLTSRKNILIEPQLRYDFNIGSHKLSSLIGSSFEKNDNTFLDLRGQGYFSDAQAGNLDLADDKLIITDQTVNYRYAAIFGRIGYSYNDKYYLNLTGRRDGSSRFGSGRRFGNFGAIGGAWEFHKEGFIKKVIPALSSGKLRGSYGITGSDNIGDYQYRDTYSSVFIPAGSLSPGGLVPSRLNNPFYQWEKNTKLEVALEFGLGNDRIFFSTNWYRERSGNQLMGLQLPSITGFTSVEGNLPATVQNTGWEFILETIPIQASSFQWTSNLNLTIPKNKLIAFPDLESSSYAAITKIGEPLGIQKLYHYTGLDPETGIYTFKDVNNDGILNNEDQIIIGDLSRKFYGGWYNNINYKNWNFSFLVEFVRQKGHPVTSKFSSPGTQFNQLTEIENHWKNSGDQSKYQALSQIRSTSFSNYIRSDAVIADASFIRLKSLAISYNFPHEWLNQFSISTASVYLKAQNLFTRTPYKGLDPQRTSSLNLPALTSINIGLKLSI